MIKRALIGHTGFVGSNLLSQMFIDQKFNSQNIREIEGQSFDEVICAGTSAAKWIANSAPENDKLNIERLSNSLKLVSAKRFILISTVDVYNRPNGLVESDIPDTVNLHPYGKHRLALESFISKTFTNYAIVRLPALFGVGLKKNALYDLMTNNQTNNIISNAIYQWYPLRRLGADLQLIIQADISLINITSEPILMETIRSRFFPASQIAAPVPNPPCYDLRSNFASTLGGENGYHLDAETILSEMNNFLNKSQNKITED
jgi:dTDP-4-dehydrorhamnose reductase